MALCFSHTAAGYLGYEAVRPAGGHRPALLAAAVLLANGPDLDFLPGMLLGHPMAYHRGVTHTLGAAVVVGALVALGVRVSRRGLPARAGLWAGAVYASHLLLDYLTRDSLPPYGGRFLWPLSHAYLQAPISLLPEVVVDGSGRGAFFASLLAPHTLMAWAREIGMLAITVATVHAVRAWQGVGGWRDVPEES
jgi:inner membrane protein